MSTKRKTAKSTASVPRAAARWTVPSPTRVTTQDALAIANQWDPALLREATEELIAKRRANQGITVPVPRPSDTQYDYDQEREHGWSVK